MLVPDDRPAGRLPCRGRMMGGGTASKTAEPAGFSVPRGRGFASAEKRIRHARVPSCIVLSAAAACRLAIHQYTPILFSGCSPPPKTLTSKAATGPVESNPRVLFFGGLLRVARGCPCPVAGRSRLRSWHPRTARRLALRQPGSAGRRARLRGTGSPSLSSGPFKPRGREAAGCLLLGCLSKEKTPSAASRRRGLSHLDCVGRWCLIPPARSCRTLVGVWHGVVAQARVSTEASRRACFLRRTWRR